MAFAIFYQRGELEQIATQITRPDLPANLVDACNKAWDSGMRRWDTAPRAPAAKLGGDNEVRILVLTSNNMNLLGFRTLLYAIANYFNPAPVQNPPIDEAAWSLDALASDMAGSSGAVEPWNAGE